MPYGCKAQIAGNTHGAHSSGTIAKMRPKEVPLGYNAEVGFFELKAAGHDLIRDSLVIGV